jgi:uncharacterized membrane protein YqaE (UPF0057 family)
MNRLRLKLLAFICPPLAVYSKYKEKQSMMTMIILAIILTFAFWIPGKNTFITYLIWCYLY